MRIVPTRSLLPRATAVDNDHDASDSDGEDLRAYWENEYGHGQLAFLQRTPEGPRLSLLPPAQAMAQALAQSEDEAAQRADADDAACLRAMPRSRALFTAATREALAQRWVDAEALSLFDWDALLQVACLALCRALQADDALPEIYARAQLADLREACHAYAGDPVALGAAVCSPVPQDALAQSLRAQATALCLRHRASTTLLLQHACKELP